MTDYPNWKERDIIHERFTPFSFDEIDEIMSYKTSKTVDHHGTRKNTE